MLATTPRRILHALTPLLLFLMCMLAHGGCTCSSPPTPTPAIGACRTRRPTPIAPGAAPGVLTVSAGTIPGSFSVTSSGEATYVLPLTAVPGRAGVEPRLAVTYDGSGDGVLGAGFSLSGLSAITRCPSNLAQDGEIREVRYDAQDKLCLDGKRLVVVAHDAETVELRTFPDSFIKILGHQPTAGAQPAEATYFEAFTPTGLIIEYGRDDGGKPLTPSGAPQAWLATKAHDGRRNAMSYAYCFADGGGYTAEVALDEIRYTSFEGSRALAASRAVTFVYGTKDPADVRVHYSGGMALQSSLRLDEIDMLGPGDALVRRYGFTYALGPTTKRTLLAQMEECGSDGVCKPATRFQYTSSTAGLQKQATTLPAPTSLRASPMLLDIDGDGLDDLVVPDTVKGLSTPGNPITNWTVAHNQGKAPGFFGPATLALTEDWPKVANPSGPSDPTQIQPELGTAIDYNGDSLTDVFLHDVYDSSPNWIVLLAQPDHTFKQHDTGIARPFPLAGTSPTPPALTTSGASVHLADVDGDGVPDLVTCLDHSQMKGGNPSEPTWTVQLWKPAIGGAPAGFAATGEPIGDQINGFPCNGELYTVDVNGDGKVDLLIGTGGTEMLPASTYSALTRHADGTWGAFDTKLPIVAAGGRVVFLDLNGDGLPDAVESGQQDQMLATWMNTGPTFVTIGHSLQGLFLGFGTGGDSTAVTTIDQGTYLHLAVPIDYNGDGLQDLLVPVPGGILANHSDVLPAWAVLLSTGSTFVLADPQIPFDAALSDSGITLADPHGPRAGDLDGDGATDIVLPLNGVLNLFHNVAADQDLLVAVAGGMNAHDPTDPGFLPDVSITYGHLSDASITNGTPAGDPSLESLSYLSHADPANGCTYPRACAIGSHRVVTGYVTNNGADGARRFAVRYRDGRYHRLGRGFLGFGERIVVDLDTLAGTASYYDNVTEKDLGTVPVFPYAGQVQHEQRWFPGLATQPDPSQLEATITDITPSFVPTNGGASYYTLVDKRRVRRAEGSYPSAAAPTVQAYVAQIAAGTGGTVLLDATTTVSAHDPFGFPLTEDIAAAGVDLTLHVERTYLNDTGNWILGQLRTQKECSSAAGLSRCRTLTRHTTQYGEIHDDTLDSDEGIPDTHLGVVYDRDVFGNVTGVTAEDAFGHHRTSGTEYDGEGIYPVKLTNAAMQSTRTTFDPGLGVLLSFVDLNQLPTTRLYDSLGRLGLEKRPDGSQTTITLSRTKGGGPQQDAWRVMRQSTTTGGADDTVEYDSMGRAIRWWWHGPDTGGAARVMQEIAYDALGEHVARRSVPVSEGTPESQLLNDVFAYDALGREVLHTTPWGAPLHTSYDGLQVTAIDALGNPTVTDQDPLGRAVTVTDAAGKPTAYTYGPFGTLYTATTPGNALTRTTRDAFGRVRKLDDPNRGTTTSIHDGFGELMSSTDALGRVATYEYDALGRPLSRLDQHGAEMLSTTWTWDTAAHGVGKLQQLAGPDGVKSYDYTPLSQLQTVTLDANGETEPFAGRLDYDNLGRVQKITYPTPQGAAPFAVHQGYDAYGHVLTVSNDATSKPYWQLTAVDGAGRFKSEAFGNKVSTTRSYFPDKQRLQSITTTSGNTAVQSLAYDYDARLDLTRRSDALQMQNKTERFRYDPVERLTCAYFSPTQDDAAPCALAYAYDPTGNGNLTTKSDVGTLVYGDPKHPHAVTGAGTDAFGYDAAGNQTARPGGATVAYTPFDLPKTISQSTGTVTFAYDGDEQRIRKSTPSEETIYFAGLYERVTATGTPTAHRYYVHSPERVAAIVTVGGTAPGTVYVHVDHLGSTDVLTNENGTAVEQRSYDPFGQRRNPAWGKPLPASFSNLTTAGFTGQENDSELGLVNMKGRLYDPKVGRFLTMDPVVSDPLSAQSWNAYSYVENNPLNFVDPTGFQLDPADHMDPRTAAEYRAYLAARANGTTPPPSGRHEIEGGRPPAKSVEGPRAAAQSGAARPPVDVSPTGSAAGHAPQPVVTEKTKEAAQNEWAQLFGGFFAGVALGAVPFAGVGQQFLDTAGALSHGTPESRRGLAVGQIAGGLFAVAGGVTGEVLGGLTTVTGIGAAVGVPAIVVSTGLVVGGLGNVAAGIRGLMTTGSGGGIRENAAKGAAYEKEAKQKVEQTQTGVVEQVTLKTDSGVRTRVDILGRDAAGQVKLTEAKSSAAAPLTRNQRAAFPEIARTGGTVVGRGKPGFPGGTQIPPTKVDIVRP